MSFRSQSLERLRRQRFRATSFGIALDSLTLV